MSHFENCVAVWEAEDQIQLLINSGQPKAKYEQKSVLLPDGPQTEPLVPAGKKFPEQRVGAATCFLTHSLLIHGGIVVGKQKPGSDLHVLQND